MRGLHLSNSERSFMFHRDMKVVGTVSLHSDTIFPLDSYTTFIYNYKINWRAQTAILVSFAKKVYWRNVRILPIYIYFFLLYLTLLALISQANALLTGSYMAVMEWPQISTILGSVNQTNVLNRKVVNLNIFIIFWGLRLDEGGRYECWIQDVILEEISFKFPHSKQHTFLFHTGTNEFEAKWPWRCLLQLCPWRKT